MTFFFENIIYRNDLMILNSTHFISVNDKTVCERTKRTWIPHGFYLYYLLNPICIQSDMVSWRTPQNPYITDGKHGGSLSSLVTGFKVKSPD